jgi:hypothetical protein
MGKGQALEILLMHLAALLTKLRPGYDIKLPEYRVNFPRFLQR